MAVVELAGELDLAVSSRLSGLLDEVATGAPELTVVDVSEVGFMDSTVLRELLRAHRHCEEAGTAMVLVGTQTSVHRLLELTGTVEVFSLAATREEALDSHG